MNTQDPLTLIRNGDRAYFHKLYYMLEGTCRKYILKRGGNQQMVDEILHEGLYRFFVRVKERDDFKINSSIPIEGVIFGFIKMVWRQKCTSDSKYQKLHKDIDAQDWLRDKLVDEQIEYTDAEPQAEHAIVMNLIHELGKDCKEVLISFYVHKTSLQEIADELSFSYDYIKLKRFRCIAQLRSKFLKAAS